MNKTWILARMLLKNGSGKSGKLGKTKLGSTGLMILIGLAFIPVCLIISKLVGALYDALVPIGQEGMLLGLALSIISAVIFVFGIFYVINVFYFSQDTDHLLPLPLKPSQILSAKFIVTLLYEYLTELFLLMPILITYGVKSGAGMMFYLYTVLIFFALPLLPLVAASIIAMIVMRFSSIAKNKDRFRMIGGIIAVVVGIGTNLFFQQYARRNMDPAKLQEMLMEQNNSMLGTISSMFPSVKLGANALLNEASLSGLAYIVLFMVVSVLVYLLFIWLGEKFYFKGVMGISESTAKRRKVTREQLDKSTKSSSALQAYFMKELRTLMRTPIFFINCILMCFLWPVFLLIPFLTQMNGLSDLSSFGTMFQDEQMSGIILAIAFAAGFIIAAGNSITSTSISREGTQLYVIQYLPVSTMKFILAKVLVGVMFSLLSVVLMLIVGVALFHIPFVTAILILVLTIPSVLFGNIVGMLIDLRSPKLNWDNEQKAVKQNMNAFLSILANFLVAASVFIAAWQLDLPVMTEAIGLFVLFAIINFFMYKWLSSVGPKWLEEAGN
ncbi:hypothetical protein NV379_18795 [Paenibacillus sp. N1-5-1-14]|uniref:putative ABC transporter permease subunit n=1 Tax=Paenibacillus radicibacter TaxID=2972488 RepID=UPI00215982FA|nr:hypothetical protein [Paenibacillus radicibacter]MCR8644706.1 hypothetical protein [Paenibacillus radicibacter]